MTQARKYIWNDNMCAHYFITNRCVQQAYLLSTDTKTGDVDNHRKDWVQNRLSELSEIFTIIIGTFSVLDNHMHINVQTRPDLTELLSDEEVAKRWLKLYPPEKSKTSNFTPEQWKTSEYAIISNQETVKIYRQRLGSLPWFMKSLSEYIARLANKESECKGRFWQGRYNSKLLTSAKAVVLASQYTDLNPIRANLAETPETSQFTGVYERIQASQAQEKIEGINEHINNGNAIHKDKKIEIDELSEKINSARWLAQFPKENEFQTMPFYKITERDYLDLLDWTGRILHPKKTGAIPHDIPHIFERLQIDKNEWLDTIINYDKLFYRIIGKMSVAWKMLTDTANQWFKGSKTNRKLFGD